MIRKAAKTSLLLCLLFLVVYGGSNRLTAFRHGVGSYYFAFERHIPFVPLMILPYMSIDLFFIAAPFLCCDERELRTLVRRVVAAILVAGVLFLWMPLRFAFDRPHVSGPLGIVFNNFRVLDQPFNQFPSLHIALQIILLGVFLQHTRGVVRIALCAWFVLIAASTLLTYQHHAIDVIGGTALGTLCVYAFREEPLRQPVVRNPKVGRLYGLATIALGALAIGLRPWGLVLLWPAASLAIVTAGYFQLGAGIFRKHAGRVPLVTRVMLWPALIGQYVSLLYYRTRSDAWNAVTDGLWIGRTLTDAEARHAVESGVTAVVDLAGEFSEARALRDLAYLQLPVLDLTAPPPELLDRAVAFVREQIDRGGTVYVHCKAGYSRTAAVAGAYLLGSGQAHTLMKVDRMLRRARPRIVIRPEIESALRAYAKRLAAPTPAAPPSTPARAVVPSPR